MKIKSRFEKRKVAESKGSNPGGPGGSVGTLVNGFSFVGGTQSLLIKPCTYRSDKEISGNPLLYLEEDHRK
ncbi:hypothetical protein QYF36_024183 [Acer negundo]|nr:hypothetical protein QYF36_020340 [Acer negundo]KAK4839703.1 hypothetical protein QYF36_024183 [Acer negundo]